jgi:transposase InsO family protein
MNDPLTMGQIAAALGLSRQAAEKRAAREGWPFETRKGAQGRGIKKLFAPGALPQDVRVAVAQWQVNEAARRSAERGEPDPAAARLEAVETNLAWYAGLSERARRYVDARAEIVSARRLFRRAAGRRTGASQAAFVGLYNRGSIRLEAWVKETVPRLSLASLKRWIDRGRLGSAGLADRRGIARKGTGTIDTSVELRGFIWAMLGQHPDCSGAQVHQGMQARFPEDQVPNLRTVQRFIQRWRAEHPQLALNLRNPDAWRHRHKVALGDAAESITRPNMLWEIDASPADLLIGGERYTVYGLIDVYSRRGLLLVSRTPRSVAMCALLRRGLLELGVPDVIRTDNGSDFMSMHARRALEDLEIYHDVCLPGHPDSKGFVERYLGSVQHGLLELCPEWIGASVAQREAIEARERQKAPALPLLTTLEELARFFDRWNSAVYERRAHKGKGMRGKSPFLRWTEWKGTLRQIKNPRALDVLLSPPAKGDGTRKVVKGGVSIEGHVYMHAELGALTGKRVSVKLNEADLGRVWVFKGQEFLCEAECPELSGVERAALIARTKARQKEYLREEKKAIRAEATRHAVRDIREDILTHNEAQAAGVAAFPKPGAPHDTPALDKYAAAAKAPRKPRPTQADEDARAEADSAYWKRVNKGLALEQERLEAAGE